MKAFAITESFGLENLRLVTRPEPSPGPGQVLLKMRAVSLNFRDLLMVRGHYNPRQPLPLIPCSDGVGEIIAVGEGVHRVSAGQRVATVFAQGWLEGEPNRAKLKTTLGGPIDGTLSELMVLDAEGVTPVPEHLSDAEAACLPCAAVTAWSALVAHGRVTAGDTVLLQGTGGVSLFALQFAKALGARVIITSSSDQKLERARQLGADATINYRQEPRWGKVAAQIAGGDGVDCVVEVGGAGTLAQSVRAVRPGGTISLIGVLSGGAEKINITPILMQGIKVQGIIVGSRALFEQMNRAITHHRVSPVIDEIFAFEQAPEAFAHLASASHMGKICLSMTS